MVGSEAIVSITQRVREALDRQGIAHAGVSKYGYRVEDAPEGSAIIRWGYGESSKGSKVLRHGSCLVTCGRALRYEGFHVSDQQFEDDNGFYIVATERP
jgi:hypothetical protein